MHGKRKQKNAKVSQPSAAGTALADAGEFRSLVAEVERLLEEGHPKAALELAKESHKRNSSQESEALLVKTYEARIGSLLKSGLEVEARALLDLVRERYPRSKEALREIGVILNPRASLDEL